MCWEKWEEGPEQFEGFIDAEVKDRKGEVLITMDEDNKKRVIVSEV